MDDLEEKLRRLLKEEEEKKKKVNWLGFFNSLSEVGKKMQTPEAQNAIKGFNEARHKLRKSQWELCQKFPDDGLCKKLRERGPLFQPLIYKYGISERDLYVLGVIEEKKASAHDFFEKSKLGGKALTILASYKVGFFENSELIEEINFESYQTNPELIEKYGKIDLDTIKSKNNSGCVFLIVLIILVVLLVWFVNR